LESEEVEIVLVSVYLDGCAVVVVVVVVVGGGVAKSIAQKRGGVSDVESMNE
jgi:hypothetical protein